jgi:hypothetical protein
VASSTGPRSIPARSPARLASHFSANGHRPRRLQVGPTRPPPLPDAEDHSPALSLHLDEAYKDVEGHRANLRSRRTVANREEATTSDVAKGTLVRHAAKLAPKAG